MSSYDVNVFVSFKTEALVDPQQQLMGINNASHYLNTVPGSQTCTISAHNLNQIVSLKVTSNGINSDDFNLYPIKYVGEKVNFTVNLIDVNGYQVKDYPLLPLSSFSFSIVNSTSAVLPFVDFYSNFGSLSSLQQGGFFKGYFISSLSANNVSLLVKLNTGNLQLSGFSNIFSIYPSCGIYDVRKVNENFDQTAAYNSLVYQPILFDQYNFFNNFLGQIVGNANSDPNTLGIEVYEKIANYVANVDDIDYSNLNQLKSLLDNINVSYENFNYEYPPSLRRLADILSVKHKKLFGQRNQYQGNFDSKGYYNSNRYGTNKGTKLDIETTLLSAGPAVEQPFIIAYEKFSSLYTVVNMNLLNLNSYYTSSPGISTYPLSSINNSWGWNLVLPDNVSGVEVNKYYQFYQFKPTVQGSLLQKFIDFDNPNNTLNITNSGYKNYIEKGGIMDNILLTNLYTNLQVITCQSDLLPPPPSIIPSVTPSITPSLTPSATPPSTLWTPIDGMNLMLWLDAADSNVIDLSSSNKVTTWYDKSLSASDATQLSGANQPTLSANCINGLSAILFNGTNNFMTVLKSLSSNSKLDERGGAITILYVSKSRVITTSVQNPILSNRRYIPLPDSGRTICEPDLWPGICNPSPGRITAENNINNPFNSPLQFVFDMRDSHIISYVSPDWGGYSPGIPIGDFKILRLNGGSLSANRALTACYFYDGSLYYQSNLPLNIGRFPDQDKGGNVPGLFYNGAIGEILMYFWPLTGFDLAQPEGYLAWKWGLQSTLPNDHQFKNAPPTIAPSPSPTPSITPSITPSPSM